MDSWHKSGLHFFLFPWATWIHCLRFEWRPNCFCQFFHVCFMRKINFKIIFTNLTSICFYCLCRLSVCLLRSFFCPNILLQKLHFNGFFFSCTVWTCLFIFDAKPKLFWQMLHWCCFRFSCTHSMCFRRLLLSKAQYSHT